MAEESSSSNSTAVVAIVVLVLIALGAVFYFMNRGGGGRDSVVPDKVEVDVDTGEVTVLKMVAVHDVGHVLNAQTLRGQVYGSLAQGVGYALYEQVLTRDGWLARTVDTR